MRNTGHMTRTIAAAGCLLLVTGCAFPYNFGWRPDRDEPKATAPACEKFDVLALYGRNLQEAYHSRATFNRSLIYVAGTVLLGTAAATGGLGAVGAATLTIALVSISGGFASGVFAMLDNSQLAEIYTSSANEIQAGLAESKKQLDPSKTQASCLKAWQTLDEKITAATVKLESARTDSAAGALERAKEKLKAAEDAAK